MGLLLCCKKVTAEEEESVRCEYRENRDAVIMFMKFYE